MKYDNKCRRRFCIANRFQRKILTLVFFSTVIPLAIAVICLFYLTFNVLASEMGIPEAIAYTLLPAAGRVAAIAAAGFLISIVLIWMLAHRVSRRLAGPLERLCNELDSRISGKEKGYIYFRRGDYLAIVAGRINSLLDRIKD